MRGCARLVLLGGVGKALYAAPHMFGPVWEHGDGHVSMWVGDRWMHLDMTADEIDAALDDAALDYAATVRPAEYEEVDSGKEAP